MRRSLNRLARLGIGASLVGAALLGSEARGDDLPDIVAPLRTGQKAPADTAVVIGIEAYAFVPSVPYASRDADAVYNFLVYTRGIPASRVRRLTQDADRENILAAVEEAGRSVEPGGTVWIYFAGHGVADPVTKQRLLLGNDVKGSADSMSARGVAVDDVTQRAVRGGGRVHLLIDACYAGVGRDGGELLEGKRFVVPSYALAASPQVTEWSAAGPSQLSGPLPAARHGAFTYLAIGALRGWADGEVDGERDGVVTAAEGALFVNRALRELAVHDQESQLVVSDAQAVTLSHAVKERSPSFAAMASPGPQASEAVVIAGSGGDYAALARQAEAARSEREAAERRAKELEAQLATERRRRLDEAAAEVRARATRDFQAIEALVKAPTEEARPVLERWLADYGSAQVKIDDVQEPVAVAEVAVVRQAVQRLAGPGVAGERWAGKSGYAMRSIPAGSYHIGCTKGQWACDEYSKPAQPVRLTRSFFIGETEVTRDLWMQVMDDLPWQGTQIFEGRLGGACVDAGTGNTLPASCVSWYAAVTFANALSKRDKLKPCYVIRGTEVSWPKGPDCTGYRLPTEAEWEVAARGGVDRAFSGGDDICEVGNVANSSRRAKYALMGLPIDDKVVLATCDDGYTTLAPVGSFRENGFGLRDMTGNVAEWTWDIFWSYGAAEVTDPMGAASGSGRVVRGAGWYFSDRDSSNVSFRDGFAEGDRSFDVGLRLVRTVPAP